MMLVSQCLSFHLHSNQGIPQHQGGSSKDKIHLLPLASDHKSVPKGASYPIFFLVLTLLYSKEDTDRGVQFYTHDELRVKEKIFHVPYWLINYIFFLEANESKLISDCPSSHNTLITKPLFKLQSHLIRQQMVLSKLVV